MLSSPNSVVLVVDDCALIRAIVVSALKGVGCHRVIEAADGLEGLRLMHGNSVRMVVSDLNMPLLDGLGFVRAIRSEHRWRDVPFLLITAEPRVSIVRAALDAGVTDVVRKPFSISTLSKRLIAILDRKPRC